VREIDNMIPMTDRRGITSLDALILTIGLLLVVAVVAAAVMSTTQNLMKRDQMVQKEKTSEMQRPIVVEAVRGRDYNNDKRLDAINIAIRLREGDDPVRFNETPIVVNSKVMNCTSLGYGPDADPDCTFNITYGKRGRDWTEDRLSSGDFVELEYSGPTFNPGVEDTSATFIIIPSHGLATTVKMNIPSRIISRNTGLWPLND